MTCSTTERAAKCQHQAYSTEMPLSRGLSQLTQKQSLTFLGKPMAHRALRKANLQMRAL